MLSSLIQFSLSMISTYSCHEHTSQKDLPLLSRNHFLWMAAHVKMAVLMSVINGTPASMAPRRILKPSVIPLESMESGTLIIMSIFPA